MSVAYSILSFYVVYIWASSVPLASNLIIEPQLPANLTEYVGLFNTSTSALNSSSENAVVDVECDGSLFGFSPNYRDCAQAKEYIVPDFKQMVWGQRHTGLSRDVFPLPYLIIGGRLLPQNPFVKPVFQ